MKKETKAKITSQENLSLQLYVSGMSPKSLEAIRNMKILCDKHLKDNFELEIIDIYKHHELAAEQSIIFCPSLIKQKPLPKKILIGTLQDSEKVINGLGITIDKPE